MDDEVLLFIPPDSPRPNLDHVEHIDLDSLPHSDWIKLEPTEVGPPLEPSGSDELPADDGYETGKDDPMEEDGGWVDLFEAQGKPGISQSTLKSEEVRPHFVYCDNTTNDYPLIVKLDGRG